MTLLIPVAVVLLHDSVDRLYGELSSAEYYEPFQSVPWWLPMIFAPAIAAAYGAWRRVETSALAFAALVGAAVAYAAFLIWPLVLLYIEAVIDPSSVS
jgi:hypothetical protein